MSLSFQRSGSMYDDFGIPHPTRAGLMDILATATAHMDFADAQEVRWAVAGMRVIAFGADHYAGCDCPLRAAGFERNWCGAWDVKGGYAFQMCYDDAVQRITGLRGPGAIGVAVEESR